MQAKYQDTVSHLKLVLDMLQRGAYPQTLSIDNVVHLANSRFEGEVSQPFKELSYDEVVSTRFQESVHGCKCGSLLVVWGNPSAMIGLAIKRFTRQPGRSGRLDERIT